MERFTFEVKKRPGFNSGFSVGQGFDQSLTIECDPSLTPDEREALRETLRDAIRKLYGSEVWDAPDPLEVGD